MNNKKLIKEKLRKEILSKKIKEAEERLRLKEQAIVLAADEVEEDESTG